MYCGIRTLNLVLNSGAALCFAECQTRFHSSHLCIIGKSATTTCSDANSLGSDGKVG